MMPQRQHRASLPFYAYSSFNKKGGRVHAKVAATRNRVLNLWAEMASYSTIAEELDISVTTVVETIARAKRLKDPRAMRSHRDRKVLKADIRRKEIARLAKQGFTAREIAKALKCTKRLVQIRLRENGHA
jgi:DNA-binding CsgD family transcriptional regulator